MWGPETTQTNLPQQNAPKRGLQRVPRPAVRCDHTKIAWNWTAFICFFYNGIVNFFPRIQLNRPQPLKRPFNGFNRDSLYTYGIMKNFVVRTSRLRMINIKLLRFLIIPRWVRRAKIQSQHLITDLCLESGIEISQIPKLIPFFFHSYFLVFISS